MGKKGKKKKKEGNEKDDQASLLACLRVILSPRPTAIPCFLLRMRTYPETFPSGSSSTLTFAKASSPIVVLFCQLFSAHHQKRKDDQGRTKDAAGIKVGREEATITLDGSLGGEAAHVGDGEDVLEELLAVADVRVDDDLVLPLELGPHDPEHDLATVGRLDVVHDVDADVVEHDTVLVGRAASSNVVDEVTKDHTALCRGHLDVGLDPDLVVRSDCVRLRSLAQLEITQCRQLEAHILKCILCPVDHHHIFFFFFFHQESEREQTPKERKEREERTMYTKDNIIAVDMDVSFSVERVRETSELVDTLEACLSVVLFVSSGLHQVDLICITHTHTYHRLERR